MGGSAYAPGMNRSYYPVRLSLVVSLALIVFPCLSCLGYFVPHVVHRHQSNWVLPFAETNGVRGWPSRQRTQSAIPSLVILHESNVNGYTENEGPNGISTTTTMISDATGIVDRAPCHDTVCSSVPIVVEVEDDGAARTPTPQMLGGAMDRLADGGDSTVWSEFGRIAAADDTGTLANLGQGFPDWAPPEFAVEGLIEAARDITGKPHQYTRTAGHPSLVKELAGRYSFHLNRKIDGFAEVAVTVGASQALYLCLQTLLKPGDEVILFEPFFDLYLNQIRLAGGTPVFVPLTFRPYGDDEDNDRASGGEWIMDPILLEKAMTPRTRAVILNSPHNPTGKVFTRQEMQAVSSVVLSRPGVVVLSDEVYKYIVHSPPRDENAEEDGKPVLAPGHIHVASLPGMFDRTITVSSAGKTFSATGWQVGWCIGPPSLIAPIHQLLPYVQFCASTVIQEALARTLRSAELPYRGRPNYYVYLKEMYTTKRDILAAAVREAGFGLPDPTLTPGGGFFLFARVPSGFLSSKDNDNTDGQGRSRPGDWTLCRTMALEQKVLCIPSSPFFSPERVAEGASQRFIRIAFCKTDATIERAAEAFRRLRESPITAGSVTLASKDVTCAIDAPMHHDDNEQQEVEEFTATNAIHTD